MRSITEGGSLRTGPLGGGKGAERREQKRSKGVREEGRKGGREGGRGGKMEGGGR